MIYYIEVPDIITKKPERNCKFSFALALVYLWDQTTLFNSSTFKQSRSKSENTSSNFFSNSCKLKFRPTIMISVYLYRTTFQNAGDGEKSGSGSVSSGGPHMHNTAYYMQEHLWKSTNTSRLQRLPAWSRASAGAGAPVP